MKKINFTEQELQELEALQILGGDTASPQDLAPYNDCNHKGCTHMECHHQEGLCNHTDTKCSNIACGSEMFCHITIPHLYNCFDIGL